MRFRLSPELQKQVELATKGIYEIPKIRVKPNKRLDKKKAKIMERVWNEVLRKTPDLQLSWERRVKKIMKQLRQEALYGKVLEESK